MKTSIQEIINTMRKYRKQPSTGHLQNTANNFQCVYFEESTNTRAIIEWENETLLFYWIPQTIKVVTENQIKNFEIYSFTTESIPAGEVNELINRIAEQEYAKELLFICSKLAMAGRGKAIIIK